MRMLAESGSGDILFPGTQVAPFTVTSHGRRDKAGHWGLFYWTVNPSHEGCVPSTSPKSHLLVPSHQGYKLSTHESEQRMEKDSLSIIVSGLFSYKPLSNLGIRIIVIM